MEFKTASLMSGLDVLVGISGGKDSVVCLDLCCRFAHSVIGYFLYCFPQLSFQQDYLTYLSRRYRVIIEQYPHPARSFRLHHGLYRKEALPEIPKIGFKDIWETLKAHHPGRYFVVGEKKNDSLARRGKLSRWGNFQKERGWLFPLADWTNRDVLLYMRQRGLPLPPDYGRLGLRTSFGGLEGLELSKLEKEYPDDYAKIIAEFPFVKAVQFRDLKISRLPRRYHLPKQDHGGPIQS